MEEIEIRKATTADRDVIYRFVCGLEQEQFDLAAFSKCYELCLAKDNNHYLVASVNGNAIGYISCHGQLLLHHAGMVYEIQEMYVAHEYRSKGVGKQLLEKLEELIGADDYKLLEVSSNMKRADAHRFYLDNGFNKTTYKFNKVR